MIIVKNSQIEIKRELLYKALQQYSAKYDKKYNIKFGVSYHFAERLIERFHGNFDKAILEIIKAIDDNICLVIYYLHMDGYLPERGKISFGDYEIRGNVVDNRYVLYTFLD